MMTVREETRPRARMAVTSCRFGCGYARDWRSAVLSHEKACQLNPDWKPDRSRCGTATGYARHRRQGEPPCVSCRDAYNEDVQRRRAPQRKEPEQSECGTCGVKFSAPRRRKYCSRGCERRDPEVMARQRAYALDHRIRNPRPHAVKCEMCGAEAMVSALDVKFCSHDCSVLWRLENPELDPCRPPRRATSRKRPPKFSRQFRLAIYERDGWTCQLCGDPVDRTLHPSDPWAATLDHIVCQAWTDEPDHSPSNLRLAHRWCNSLRGDETHPEALTLFAN